VFQSNLDYQTINVQLAFSCSIYFLTYWINDVLKANLLQEYYILVKETKLQEINLNTLIIYYNDTRFSFVTYVLKKFDSFKKSCLAVYMFKKSLLGD